LDFCFLPLIIAALRMLKKLKILPDIFILFIDLPRLDRVFAAVRSKQNFNQ